MSSTPTRSGDPLAPRGRFRLVAAGLFLPVAVTVVLAVAYLDAVKSQQRAVEVAGRQLARRIADRGLAAASRIGDAAAAAVLGPVQRMPAPTSAAAFRLMTAATDSLRACRCGPLKEGAYFFYWVPSTGEFAASAPVPQGADPRTRLAAARVPLTGPPGEIQGAGSATDTVPWLIHYATVGLPGGGVALIGFDISMTSWWTDTFRPAVSTTRRQFFPMVPDPDTAFLAFLTAGQRVLAREEGTFDGPSATVSTAIGSDFYLGVTLNPAILSLILAAAAPPSYPLLIGAIVASALASAIALALLHQVRRTVVQREAFVASISHELRTPLTEVLLLGESLQLDRATPGTKRRAADSIVRETRRLIGLVENALTIAGAGRAPASRERPRPIVAASVVRGVLVSLGPAIAERASRVETTFDEAARCAVDPVALDRIVTNLVENALRYGPSAQVIRITVEGRGAETELVVFDQGPGVPVGERETIWDPFMRGRTSPRTAGAGVGLGLAIVRHLAESAGGSATIRSETELGTGASFVIRLPST